MAETGLKPCKLKAVDWMQVQPGGRVSDDEYRARLAQLRVLFRLPVWVPRPPRERCWAAIQGGPVQGHQVLSPREWRRCPFNAAEGWRYCGVHQKHFDWRPGTGGESGAG